MRMPMTKMTAANDEISTNVLFGVFGSVLENVSAAVRSSVEKNIPISPPMCKIRRPNFGWST